MHNIFLLFSLILLSACLQTAAEVSNERAQESQEQIQTQTLEQAVSDLSLQNQQMQKQINDLTGRLEELAHTNSNAESSSNSQQSILTELKAKIESHEQQLTEHREFIGKLTQMLQEQPSSKTTEPKVEENNPYAKAVKNYNQKKYTQAREQFLEISRQRNLKKDKAVVVFHHLGMMEYWNKNFDNSLVYLSKVYTEYSKSQYASEALYYVGIIFKQQKKKVEAQAILEQVIKKYPHTMYANMAKKKLKEIK